MLSYLIVGSGYRAEYFGRIAARYPALFRALYLCRSPEKAALMTERTGVAATTALPEALAFGADFAVVAVDRAHIADVTAEWAARGLPVVAETPIGAAREQLEWIWQLGKTGAKLVCCEQYHRYPILAGGLERIRQGFIGRPCSAYLSLAHDYHGISLIRRLLGTDGEPYVLHAVVGVYLQVAVAMQTQAEAPMLRKCVQHVVEERDAAIDFNSLLPVQIKRNLNFRLLSVPFDVACPVRFHWMSPVLMVKLLI